MAQPHPLKDIPHDSSFQSQPKSTPQCPKLQTKQLPLLPSPDVLMSTVNEHTGGYRLPPPPSDRTQRTPAHTISSSRQTFEDANHTVFQFQNSRVLITVSFVGVCSKKRKYCGIL